MVHLSHSNFVNVSKRDKQRKRKIEPAILMYRKKKSLAGGSNPSWYDTGLDLLDLFSCVHLNEAFKFLFHVMPSLNSSDNTTIVFSVSSLSIKTIFLFDLFF